jgi:hypothetical protein
MKRMLLGGIVVTALINATGPAPAGDGAALAAGALGGLALGTVIGSAATGPYYPGKPVGVVSPPPPVYVEAYDESPACFIKRRRYVDEFGDETVRRIRVCE